ncbi:GNAT family N-acetyltransferase [Rhizobium leucaenae]|uniref:N-acetylglutamate synthase-like GNAT family acetyltransferase n=1 Tax=Rhizobium leucaenae TaxID=29450 RepID=A0A7W6ZUL6_9HYPH|nr:GNAT family N-acetyltransferase [Rhizobium leucaenae]MBB4568513.1 N-acetylglutamate synthase-like GNAT family acetyltransferase [Rhizobium leucaenae]MBB6300327.1 N-acetylglutamate synthase-like GNAT family acetyltransferase [Rhizobium leucaenae]
MGYRIRLAQEADVEAISAVIQSALRETNAKDYSQDIISRVAQNFTPAAVRRLLGSRIVCVATKGDNIVGTASLDGAVIRTVFVSPLMQGQGVGTQLMAEIELIARSKGITTLVVPSSVTAQAFYAKLGYQAVRDNYHEAERTIIVERSLEQ